MPTKMKVCNNADYNKSLAKRGQLFSLLKNVLTIWYAKDAKQVSKTKFIYSEELISVLAVLRYTLKLPYRQLSGLILDFLDVMNVNLPSPNFATLNRRIKSLLPMIKDYRSEAEKAANEPYEILIDSSSINIYHTGGGHSKLNRGRRQYQHLGQVRKLHIIYSPKNKTILSFSMTKGTVGDAPSGEKLLKQFPGKISKLYADKAYDSQDIRRHCTTNNITQLIPPKINSVIHFPTKKKPLTWQAERNAAIEFIQQFDDYAEGFYTWKEHHGYGKRALVESVFSRFKRTFGFHFMSKAEVARESELAVKLNILNSHSQQIQPIFKLA